jgi:hypothetical protein
VFCPFTPARTSSVFAVFTAMMGCDCRRYLTLELMQLAEAETQDDIQLHQKDSLELYY